jgi:hypothetical protein
MTRAHKTVPFTNPFRPGAGHMPPYLAGRVREIEEFKELLGQETVLKNLVLTGLRGLGKTVLLETFKPMAVQSGWLWAGTDLSETSSISEENLTTRLLADLSVVTSTFVVASEKKKSGFANERVQSETPLSYQVLRSLYDSLPGLVSDKIKGVLEFVWPHVEGTGRRGIIFAYDEAQNLADHKAKDQYPLSLLLDVFQSLQRKDMRFMLVLTGLPTLFPKLVEARTFAERMFHVISLNPLNQEETTAAITEPIAEHNCPGFTDDSVQTIWFTTKGYPYFIQYVCREVFDVWVQAREQGLTKLPVVPANEIMRKLDSDFFAGRWARSTDRQRELLWVVSCLGTADSEFTVQEIVDHPANFSLEKPFSSSHVNQLLNALSESGLVFKNRHGKYSFAVPLLGDFIKRQIERDYPPIPS